MRPSRTTTDHAVNIRHFSGVVVLLVAALGGCTSRTQGSRCTYDVDCVQGLICSNERNRQNPGVCIRPCDLHIAVAACPADAGADATSDASDATPDAPSADAPNAEAATDAESRDGARDAAGDVEQDVPALDAADDADAATDGSADATDEVMEDA